MNRYAVGTLAGVATLVLAACGAGSSASPLSLKARLIRPDEFNGFTPAGAPHAFHTATAFVTAGHLPTNLRAAWLTRLKSEGFEADVSEFLNSANGFHSGLSGVMQLGSAGSARAEVTAQAQLDEASGATTFPVRTVPGAIGIGFAGGENVLFSDGPFFYVLGYGWQGPTQQPKLAAFLSAVTKLYQRVHGHPAS